MMIKSLNTENICLKFFLEVFTRGKRLDPLSNQVRPQVVDRGMPWAVKALGVPGS